MTLCLKYPAAHQSFFGDFLNLFSLISNILLSHLLPSLLQRTLFLGESALFIIRGFTLITGMGRTGSSIWPFTAVPSKARRSRKQTVILWLGYFITWFFFSPFFFLHFFPSTKDWTLCILGKHSTTEIYPQPFGDLWNTYHYYFPSFWFVSN